MKIKILCVGKLKEKWLVEASAEYEKRLSRFCKLEIVEKADAPDTWSKEKAMEVEAQSLLASIDKKDYVILCDLHGKAYDSVEFSASLMKSIEKSGAHLTFVIAGSHGFTEEIRHLAKEKISLSKLTFTHQMSRILLLEQIYRAFKISKGENYHK